jgi:hypothetical protein
MGADVYLQSVSNKAYKEWNPKFDEAVAKRDALPDDASEEERAAAQAEVEAMYDKMYGQGYYRDSYNSSNLLWLLGMSYWTDVEKLLNQEGTMSVTNMEKLLAKVNRAAKVSLKDDALRAFIEGKAANMIDPDKDREKQIVDWMQYFRGKYESLTSLLRQAIELKEPLLFSV